MYSSFFMLISTFTIKIKSCIGIPFFLFFLVQISIVNLKWSLHHSFIFSYVTVVRYRHTAPGWVHDDAMEGRNRDEGSEWAAALGQRESEQVQGGKITTINKASPCNLSLIWLPALPAFSFFCMLISMSYFLSEICLCFYPCPPEHTAVASERDEWERL